MPGARYQAGVTLIEALITGVILAIGILGVVSLLSLSKVSQNEAVQRSRAVALADDMLERIRRNPTAVVAYMTGSTGLETPLEPDIATAEPDPNCSSASSCTPAQLAAHDRWVWGRVLAGNTVTMTSGGEAAIVLRNLRACILFNADAGKTSTGIVSIILQWQGLRETIDAVPGSGTACGGESAGTDPTRRQVTLDSYVIDETEII